MAKSVPLLYYKLNAIFKRFCCVVSFKGLYYAKYIHKKLLTYLDNLCLSYLKRRCVMNYSFSVEHAQQYGVDEAIMIHNFQFWITQNLANNRHQHDGRTWTYNSQVAYTHLFPFWNRDQIKRILKSLVKQDILIKGNYNKAGFDKTTWYAFKDEENWISIIKKTATTHTNQPLGENAQSKGRKRPIEGEKTPNLYQIKNTDKKPDNNNNVDDDNFEKIFSPEEQPAAKKVLSKIPTQKQVEVLAVLLVKIKTSTIKNKGSYLRSMVNSVLDGTFTPLSPKKDKAKAKVKEIWEKQGFKSQKEYDQAMFEKTLTKYAKNKQ